ncbi:hypothetical protein NQ314_005470 [Rhamnusium bicolor]|uniref:Glycoside hydrolase family 2 catalytic domain-containing protein n=1 Tax=Rhamnusium bicolor TaxID=1586634 RepID=A0AAV8ZIP5_9CUCU|nr:hypothetical protein NQ314_005470 [Rhamnusium bicolor]
MKAVLFISFLTILHKIQCESGILYPRSSKTRELVSLDGLWQFSLYKQNTTKWSNKDKQSCNLEEVNEDLELMPVPASYNDISTNAAVRDHVGTVRYQRQFIVPNSWEKKRVWLRFGSVCYSAKVHSPFFYFNEYIFFSGRIEQEYTFDFFNYAGIDRPVVLYTTEQTYVDDITITTKINGNSGIVDYNISIEGNDIFSHIVTIVNKRDEEIVTSDELSGSLIEVLDNNNNLLDHYEQPFGVRELSWDNKTFKINGKPLYLRGFGRHEDSDIRGKGLDLPLIIRDHNLIKWIGANSYRTSHYPYAEEIMDLADSLGIMIIDEVPAVNTE